MGNKGVGIDNIILGGSRGEEEKKEGTGVKGEKGRTYYFVQIFEVSEPGVGENGILGEGMRPVRGSPPALEVGS